MQKSAFLVLALAICVKIGSAQTHVTEHVLRLDEGVPPPPATLADLAWLAGSWSGDAFGGTFEEIWTPPTAGSMAGLFKLMQDGAVTIYEIQTITEEDGRLVWKVKHFGPDFKAWEEKEEFVGFPLIKIEEGAAYFDGLTLVRDDENLIVYLAASEHGETREEKLIYRPMAL